MSKEKSLYIAITSVDWERLRNKLLPEDNNETAAVLLCGASAGESERRLLVRRTVEVPPHLYRSRNRHHLEIAPEFYNEIITDCERSKLTPVIIHSHPFEGQAWYSASDNYGESRLLPVLASLLPEASPSSLVVTKTAITGRRFVKECFVPLAGLKVFGRRSQILEFTVDDEASIHSQFERQVRAFGESGQRLIQKIKVGVIGVGGIGSLVVEQLARVGITDLVIVDDDRIELSNVSRILGSQLNDAGRNKVEVVGAHAKALGVGKVLPLADSSIRQAILLRLRDRDIIINCVDNDRSRAIINRFSHQYLVPVVDLGTRLDGRSGAVDAAAGRVSLIGSGMTCLRCSHHLNTERIRAESMSAHERKGLQREGYVMGIDEPVPAVISLNTVIAGLGVTAALNLFVGLTGDQQPLGQIYDARSGSVFAIDAIHEAGCDICDESLGVKGLGDTQIVSAY